MYTKKLAVTVKTSVQDEPAVIRPLGASHFSTIFLHPSENFINYRSIERMASNVLNCYTYRFCIVPYRQNKFFFSLFFNQTENVAPSINISFV